jgi:CRISPR/Cas system-associated endoribonuclease Cas2
MPNSYLIVYDIRELDYRTRQRVSRRLRKLQALKLQQSVWESGRLAELKSLADSIGRTGGKALVLKKRAIYVSHL